MAPYIAPDFDHLKDSVALDLRDSAFKTFTEPAVGALINEGIAELDRLRPWQRVVALPWVYPAEEIALGRQRVLSLEGQNDVDQQWLYVPQASHVHEGIATDGWDQWGDTLILPKGILLSATTAFRALVYEDRDPLVAETDVAQFFDMTDEQVVRCYARWTALEALLHDRTLYQQWQTQANNSDVSPTQLLQMASTFKQEWSDLRKRAVLLRRAA